jgi:hypothetical protein
MSGSNRSLATIDTLSSKKLLHGCTTPKFKLSNLVTRIMHFCHHYVPQYLTQCVPSSFSLESLRQLRATIELGQSDLF